MATFFVGQRVRLVGSWEGFGQSPVGQEGRIAKRGGVGARTRKNYDWTVMTDSLVRVQCDSHEIEPILPEGHAPSVYSFQELMDKCRSGVPA